jgi:autotransporter-associated beta strand protein
MEFYTTQPAAGSTNAGLYITGGTVAITNNLDMGVDRLADSTVSVRIDGGSLTVGGVLTIALNNESRWSVLDVNGGNLTVNDTATGISVGGTRSGNAELLVRAGTASVGKISLGQATAGSTNMTAVVNLTGGSLYVGSGGISQVSTGAGFVSTITFTGGTLGAAADWSSALPMTLGGTTIQTADAASIAHNISLSGVLSGSGGLTKTGAGQLTVSGANTYSGATTVSAGTLALGAGNVLPNAGALILNGGTFSSSGYSDTVGALTNQSSSTLALGTNTTGTLTFASGSYTAGTLTINNWSGIAGISGTADRIFITAAPGATFLTNLTFTGYQTGAIRLGTGEIVPSGSLATKLAITAVNGGSSPTVGAAFSVVVQAQGTNGTPQNVTADTAVTLSLNTGTGTLGGTVTGIIANGSSSVTISGVTYSKAENGVILTATRTSGLTLTAANSSSFNVGKATVTVTAGLTASNKTYDGTTTATITSNNVVLAGVLPADTNNVRLATNGCSATFASATAGTGKTVTLSGLTLTGSAAANYTLTQPTLNANITAASTSNALTSSLNPALPGSNITFTATISVVSPGGGTPTGNVIFQDGSTVLGTNALNGSAVAIFSTNALAHGSHTITAGYAGDGNFLGSTNSVSQVVNARPIAVSDVLPRNPNTGAKVRIATLLTNDTDPDGDALTFISVSATNASGGTNVVLGNWISYKPLAGFTNADSFSYIIADSYGLQATGTVSVTILVDSALAQNIGSIDNLGTNSSLIHFSEIPARTYTVQYTTNLVTPVWQTLGTNTADAVGKINYTDSPATNSPARSYRSTNP